VRRALREKQERTGIAEKTGKQENWVRLVFLERWALLVTQETMVQADLWDLLDHPESLGLRVK